MDGVADVFCHAVEKFLAPFFITMIGRCITLARVIYYKSPGHTFPVNAQYVRLAAVPDGKAYPGAELILTPPITLEPILIDEGVVNTMLSEYKSHFPKEPSKG